MSVPQIVVVVTRSSASRGPTLGIGFSSRTMRHPHAPAPSARAGCTECAVLAVGPFVVAPK